MLTTQLAGQAILIGKYELIPQILFSSQLNRQNTNLVVAPRNPAESLVHCWLWLQTSCKKDLVLQNAKNTIEACANVAKAKGREIVSIFSALSYLSRNLNLRYIYCYHHTKGRSKTVMLTTYSNATSSDMHTLWTCFLNKNKKTTSMTLL